MLCLFEELEANKIGSSNLSDLHLNCKVAKAPPGFPYDIFKVIPLFLTWLVLFFSPLQDLC